MHPPALVAFARAYLAHKIDPDLVDFDGFTIQDFEAFEHGAFEAASELQIRQLEMQPFVNDLKNRLADLCRAYEVYKADPDSYAGEFPIRKFQQFEARMP